MKAKSFLCDKCGSESKLEWPSCPLCGVSFSYLVRCSQCHYQAAGKFFDNGCPSCGYLRPLPPAKRSPGPKERGERLLLPFTLALIWAVVLVLALLCFYE